MGGGVKADGAMQGGKGLEVTMVDNTNGSTTWVAGVTFGA